MEKPATDAPDRALAAHNFANVWALRYRNWRNRLISNQNFRNAIARFPLTAWLARRNANALFRLSAGFVHSQVLFACVQLGIFERLARRVSTAQELASGGEIELSRMRMLLDAACNLRLIAKVGEDLWVLDDMGAVMASDRGLLALVEHHALLYRDLEDPAGLLRASDPQTRTRRLWAYVRNGQQAGLEAENVRAYSDLMRESQVMLADFILSARPFGNCKSVMDVGGGDGMFLAEAGARHPEFRLHLFDLPPVADRARKLFEAKGLQGRATATGGDFLEDALPDDCECVTLVRVICDHDDDVVVRLLGNLHRSLKPGTRIVIAEAMAGADEGSRMAAAYFDFYFLAMGSGKNRGSGKIAAMLTAAGFKDASVKATANPLLATLVMATR